MSTARERFDAEFEEDDSSEQLDQNDYTAMINLKKANGEMDVDEMDEDEA